jgi:hypothetical protein
MEHSIHVAAGYFVKTVSPTSSCSLLIKIKHAFRHAQLDVDNMDVDVLDAGLAEFDDENGEDEEVEDDGENLEFGVGDAIGKALALVKQVILVIDITLT